MSTILLYHGYSIVGYKYVRTDYREGDIILLSIKKEIFNALLSMQKQEGRLD